MNYNASISGNYDIKAIGVSARTSSISSNIAMSYDQIDYSDAIDPVVITDNNLSNDQSNIIKNTLFTNKFLSDVIYIMTKGTFTDYVKSTYFPNSSNISSSDCGKSIVATAFVAGFAKYAIGVSAGYINPNDSKVMFNTIFNSGGLKELIKVTINTYAVKPAAKKAYMKIIFDLAKQKHPAAGKKAIERITKELEKAYFKTPVNKLPKATLPKGASGIKPKIKNDQILKSVFKAQNVQSTIDIGVGSLVDYVASVTTTLISSKMNGTFSSSNFGEFAKSAGLGTNLLTSVYKTVCSVAFQRMFSCMGPVGGEFGKRLGTVVGAAIGNVWVKAFNEDQAWCAVAGAATLAGAIGGLWAGAAIAAAVTSSVPVAGWIVGAAIIVGAALSTFVIWIVYKLRGN